LLRLLALAVLVASPFLVYRLGTYYWRVELQVTGQEYPSTVAAAVVRVIDGDTLAVRIEGKEERVQLLGIDAPEVFQRVSRTDGDSVRTEWVETADPAPREAQRQLSRLVTGRKVTLEFEQRQCDRYGRLLAYVWVPDGSDGKLLVNEWMLRQGLARLYGGSAAGRYAERLKNAARLNP